MDIKNKIEEILLTDYQYVDCYTVDKLLDLFAVSGQSEQLRCQCKKAQFTRTVDADFNPLCGRCGKVL